MPTNSHNKRTIEAAVVDAALQWWKARQQFHASYRTSARYEAAMERLDRNVVDLVQLHLNEQTIQELEAPRRKRPKKR